MYRVYFIASTWSCFLFLCRRWSRSNRTTSSSTNSNSSSSIIILNLNFSFLYFFLNFHRFRINISSKTRSLYKSCSSTNIPRYAMTSSFSLQCIKSLIQKLAHFWGRGRI
ncbi:ORF1059 [White spot syndrome virus]|uniref:ORF1059 n=1 Tax=White spot syndrome virus TaxID=342409 RepID=A0A2D3I5D9_9VIRU|nr:ORF1059 [White spot syndrome virus]